MPELENNLELDQSRQLTLLELPKLPDSSYSIKDNKLAESILGNQIKPVYKRCFEGILTKLRHIDLDHYIKNDLPVKISLSTTEYKSMFPRDPKVQEIFKETARYYTKYTSLEIPGKTPDDEVSYVNIVDKAEILSDGSLQILFTRSILPHLNSATLLALNISEFSKLRAKYSQKIYELLMSWKEIDSAASKIKVSVERFKQILSVPESYSQSKFYHIILLPSLQEISEKTSFLVDVEQVKKKFGRGIESYIFSVTEIFTADNYEEQDDDAEEPIVNIFRDQGISDDVFEAVAENKRRDKRPRPVNQTTMEMYFRDLIRISKQQNTLSLEDCISKAVQNNYTGWLNPKWFEDETKIANEKAQAAQAKTKKQIETNKSAPTATPEETAEFIKNIKKQIKKP